MNAVRILMLTLLLSMGMSVQAQTPTFGDAQFCSRVSNLAEIFMTVRQSGIPMADVMTHMPAEAYHPEMAATRQYLEQLLVIAYDQPRYSDPQTQQRLIEDYRDKVYRYCYFQN